MISRERLQVALDAVADDWAELGRAIRTEDRYADHVSEETKEKALCDMLLRAEAIRLGDLGSFTIWQRVNTKLTGECVALLP